MAESVSALPSAAFETAVRKATKGHRDWIVWKDRSGAEHSDLCTADALKRALLAVGTKGSFTRLSASTAQRSKVRWPMGLLMWRNCRKGYDGPACR